MTIADIPSAVAAELSIDVQKKSCYDAVENVFLKLCPRIIGGVDTRDMSRFKLALPVAVLYVCGFLGILAGLTAYQASNLTVSKYLALDNVDPNAICTDVPLAVSGTYEGTWDGKWITEAGFDNSKSIVNLEFTGSRLGLPEYKVAMQYFSDELVKLGEKAKNRNSAWANMMYASYSFKVESTNMRFYSNSEATDIFFNKIQTITLTGRNGTCDTFASTGKYLSGSADWATKAFTISIPLPLSVAKNNKLIADGYNTSLLNSFQEACPSIACFVPDFFNPAFGVNRDGIDFSFDINSIITAITLNLGIVKVTSLNRMEGTKIRVRGGSSPDRVAFPQYADLIAYFDPASFSPDRVPVYCYNKTSPSLKLTKAQIDGPDICFLGSHEPGQENVMLYYPTMAQVWNNPKRVNTHNNAAMQVCNCPADKFNAYCNFQDVLWGLIFDNGNSTHAGNLQKIALDMQAFVIKDADNGDVTALNYLSNILTYSANVYYARDSGNVKLNNFTLNGAKIDNSWAKGKSYNRLLQDAWDTVCPWKTCAGFIFETYSDQANYPYRGINKYHVQLSDFLDTTFVDTNYDYDNKTAIKLQMCSDTMSLQTGMAGLSSKPPQPLTQAYYECRPTFTSAIISSFGAAAGSAGIFIQGGTIVIGTLIVLSFNIVMIVRGKKKDTLMESNTKLEVMRKYETIKVDAMCDVMESTYSTLNALNIQVKALKLDMQIAKAEKDAMMSKLLRAAERRKRATARRKAAAAAGGTEWVEGDSDDEFEEDDPKLALPGLPGSPGPKGDGSMYEDEAKLKNFLFYEESKRKEALAKLVADESDVSFFQAALKRAFERFRYLYQIEDVLLAEDEVTEAHSQKQMRMSLNAGDSDYGSDFDGSESDYQGSVVELQQKVTDTVMYPLSYLNPLSYFYSATPVTTTAANSAPSQSQQPLRLPPRVLAAPPHRPQGGPTPL